MNITTDIFLGAVRDFLVPVAELTKVGIGAELIGEDSATALYVLSDQGFKGSAFDVGHGTGPQHAVTLHHAEHNCLALGAASGEAFNRDSPDGSSQSPTMVAQWASDREFGPGLSR